MKKQMLSQMPHMNEALSYEVRVTFIKFMAR